MVGHCIEGRSQRHCIPRLIKPIEFFFRLINNLTMSAKEVDAYLAKVIQPHRSTLKELRKRITEIIPKAEEGIAWGMPAYKLDGKYIAGFAAFKNHCSYFPYSGSVFEQLDKDLEKYKYSKGALQFATDKPLPKVLVRKMVKTRLAELQEK